MSLSSIILEEDPRDYYESPFYHGSVCFLMVAMVLTSVAVIISNSVWVFVAGCIFALFMFFLLVVFIFPPMVFFRGKEWIAFDIWVGNEVQSSEMVCNVIVDVQYYNIQSNFDDKAFLSDALSRYKEQGEIPITFSGLSNKDGMHIHFSRGFSYKGLFYREAVVLIPCGKRIEEALPRMERMVNRGLMIRNIDVYSNVFSVVGEINGVPLLYPHFLL